MKRTLRGSSYFEVILYLGLFSLMATALFEYSWDVIDLSVKNRTERRVFSDARVLSERLNTIIRNASRIDATDSRFESENGKLVLEDGSGERLQITIENGMLILSRDGMQSTLHSNQTRVTFFELSSTGQATDHSEAISYSFGLDSNENDAVSDVLYTTPVVLRSGGFIRKSGL